MTSGYEMEARQRLLLACEVTQAAVYVTRRVRHMTLPISRRLYSYRVGVQLNVQYSSPL